MSFIENDKDRKQVIRIVADRNSKNAKTWFSEPLIREIESMNNCINLVANNKTEINYKRTPKGILSVSIKIYNRDSIEINKKAQDLFSDFEADGYKIEPTRKNNVTVYKKFDKEL